MTAALTQRESALCTAQSADATAERAVDPTISQTTAIPVHSAITERDWLQTWARVSKEYFTPPSVLTDRPASVAELAAYAKRATWTGRTDGPLRAAGVAWYRFIGLPITVVCRYVEWIAQRPGRVATITALIVLIWLGR